VNRTSRMLALGLMLFLAAGTVLQAQMGTATGAQTKDPLRNAISMFLGNFNAMGMYRVDNMMVKNKIDMKATDFVVIDVRPPGRYKLGHVPGSISIPLPTLLDNLGMVPMDKTAYVYCDLDQNAAFGVMTLTMLGYHAYVIGDGWSAWQKAGYPVSMK
jgi:rhodanese-related sulfurtransferase